MLLTADEVSRSLRGSWQLLQRQAEGIRLFDVSYEGFWRSFGAIVLTLPVAVVALASERIQRGLGTEGLRLADHLGLTLSFALAHVVLFCAFPLLMIGFVRLMGLERAYVPFVVAHNWTNAFLAFVFAVPMALVMLGLATPGLGAFYALAFMVIAARLRWFVARVTLGVSGGLAAALVVADFAVEIGLATLFDALTG
ncbi:hypothetical protein QNA08_05480 [Chelatococcus sp. SYSU_G07232]|uniref:Yip1 domain-containing protein n=1 Tax=Chelatococcus albus TaxID=3047466 RepID=A0ABT7AE80_9HYPH|nr:hypothetical protein [Chelatococcus sp. SYSU_G07232]MDJ1157681.1 hypothetical protein [Chelatococcus sp. SYSU_G07232]